MSQQQLDEWATLALAKMLERVMDVCIFEYGLLIRELRPD